MARQSRGKLMPMFSRLGEEDTALAESLISAFQDSIGKKMGELDALVEEEEGAFDYRMVRGLAELLRRRCILEIASVIEPQEARRAVFEEANKRGFVTSDSERRAVLDVAAKRLAISAAELENSLWADLEEEQVLKSFDAIAPADLLRQYNLSLAQTALFKAMALEVGFSGNYKQVLRQLKHLGLMYRASKADGAFRLDIEGPASLLKMTEKYGTSLAKLLPSIVRADKWRLVARVLWREKRILSLELDDRYKEIFPAMRVEEESFDSAIEEKFASAFRSLSTGWELRREPEPLIVGSSVMLPDFGFEKGGAKLYMEIVGFWTKDYLERKLEKLAKVKEQLILAVDKGLACSKFEELGEVIYYHGEVPMKEVLDILRRKESVLIEKELGAVAGREVDLGGRAIVRLEELSKEQGISIEVAKRIAGEVRGYALIGEELVSEIALSALKKKLDAIVPIKYTEVVSFLKGEGISSAIQLLSRLGYEIRWRGLDPENAVVQRAPRI